MSFTNQVLHRVQECLLVPDASLNALYGVIGVKVGCCHCPDSLAVQTLRHKQT